MKHFESKFYLQICNQQNKTVFFDPISNIEIIYEKWVAWMKSKLYLHS